jgi:cytidylate kinase
MRNWAHRGEAEEHATSSHPDQAGLKPRLFLAISRQSGSGGSEIAQLVGQRLGWPVFDKNLLDILAERFHESRRILDLVDETQNNWVFDVLGTWMDHRLVPHQKFVSQLRRIIVAAAAEYPHAVFVGRAAQFILPREEVIAVRIVAPVEYRVERIVQQRGIKQVDAKRFIQETDADRREFVKHFFLHDIDDSRIYDLVIDAQAAGPTGACEQIVARATTKASGRS